MAVLRPLIGRTGQALAYLQPHSQCADRSLLYQDLAALTSGLEDRLESHHFYPALRYFRFGERRYAMSQMLEDANKHFIVCRPADEDCDDASVNELLAAFDLSNQVRDRIDRTGFAKEYDTQFLIWRDKLRVLEICTGNSRQSDVHARIACHQSR